MSTDDSPAETGQVADVCGRPTKNASNSLVTERRLELFATMSGTGPSGGSGGYTGLPAFLEASQEAESRASSHGKVT